jgi:hypothetical protein
MWGMMGVSIIVVDVEPEPVTGQPLHDHLAVVPCPARHLVADELSLFQHLGLANRATELCKLIPYLAAFAGAVAGRPVPSHGHDLAGQLTLSATAAASVADRSQSS